MGLSVFSCSKDKEEPAPEIDAKNELEYNGQTYSLNHGAVTEYGYDGTHTNNEFHLFKVIAEDNPVVPVYLYLDLYSPHENTFSGGTFHFIDTDGPEVDLEGKAYFDDGFLIRNMNLTDETAEEVVYVNGGSVKISGEGTQYKLEFNLELENGETVIGSYGGSFERLSPTDALWENHSIPFMKSHEED